MFSDISINNETFDRTVAITVKELSWRLTACYFRFRWVNKLCGGELHDNHFLIGSQLTFLHISIPSQQLSMRSAHL